MLAVATVCTGDGRREGGGSSVVGHSRQLLARTPQCGCHGASGTLEPRLHYPLHIACPRRRQSSSPAHAPAPPPPPLLHNPLVM